MLSLLAAHAVVRAHKGKNKALYGASLMLAPAPADIVWANANITPAARANSKVWGVFLLIGVCFLNTLPLIIVAAAANLVSLSYYVHFLRQWQEAGTFGDWSFSLVRLLLCLDQQPVFSVGLELTLRHPTSSSRLRECCLLLSVRSLSCYYLWQFEGSPSTRDRCVVFLCHVLRG